MYSSYYVLFIIVLFLILNKILKISNNYKNKYIWDGNTIACPDCRENVELVSIKNNNIIQYFIYIRNESDIISNVIKTKGDWPDCQKIRQLWFSLPGMEVGMILNYPIFSLHHYFIIQNYMLIAFLI